MARRWQTVTVELVRGRGCVNTRTGEPISEMVTDAGHVDDVADVEADDAWEWIPALDSESLGARWYLESEDRGWGRAREAPAGFGIRPA